MFKKLKFFLIAWAKS